ncbi:MAG: ketopantoate reductase, partial [Planctomycetota bacterium]
RHLQLGGAEIHFLVKPKHLPRLEGGAVLYPLNRRRAERWRPVRLEGYGLLTDPAEVGRSRWDQVWLCVPSTALREPWLETLAGGLGDATLVMLQPGLDDRERILGAGVAAGQLVQGLITLIAYFAPLPTESLATPGVAYWLPPGAKTPMSGERTRVDAVVSALRAGRCPAKVSEDVAVATAFGSAILMPHIAALELAGWRFATLRRGPLLPLARQASLEALAIAARHHGRPVPWRAHLVRPLLVRLATRLAPWFVPFDLETYLRVHFTKVGAQTRQHLETLHRHGEALGIPTPALDTLAARLGPA